MESVDSPRPKSPEPRRGFSIGSAQLWLAGSAAAMTWGTAWLCPRAAPWCWTILCILLLGLLWSFHLQRASLPESWAFLLPALVGIELLLWLRRCPELSASAMTGTACTCVLLYMLMKTVGGAIAKPELPEVAGAAMILAMAVYANALVLLFWGVLSVILWMRCRARYGGILKSALLIYVPSAFGILALTVARKMIPGLHLDALSAAGAFSAVPNLGADSANGQLQRTFPALVLAASAILTRVVERRAGYADLAFLGTMLFLTESLVVQKLPGMLRTVDVGVILYAGTMSLLALAPPRRVLSLVFLTATICGSLCVRFDLPNWRTYIVAGHFP